MVGMAASGLVGDGAGRLLPPSKRSQGATPNTLEISFFIAFRSFRNFGILYCIPSPT